MTIIDKLVNKQTTTQLQVLCTHTNMHTRLSAEFLHFLDFLFFSPTCTKMYLFTILCIYCGCTQSHLTFKNKYICNLLSMSPQNNSELTKHRRTRPRRQEWLGLTPAVDYLGSGRTSFHLVGSYQSE